MKTWSDVDELDSIQNTALGISKKVSTLVRLVNNIEDSLEIPNIGMLYNNKMVEIHNFFKYKKVPYSRSTVNRNINSYFISMIDEATENLEKYVSANLGRFKLFGRLLFNKRYGEKYLIEYMKIAKSIGTFSIEKDVSLAINSSLDNYLEHSIRDGWYNGKINDNIQEINDELSSLGISTDIDYRNIEYNDTHDENLKTFYTTIDELKEILSEEKAYLNEEKISNSKSNEEQRKH